MASGKMNTGKYGNKEKTSKTSGAGSGANKRDAYVATSPSGGKTLRYRSGQVKVTHGSMAKYKTRSGSA